MIVIDNSALVAILRREPEARLFNDVVTKAPETAMQVVPHDRDLALPARDAFLRYGKGRHQARLNMGNCASYALAKSRRLSLLFKGDDFTRTDLPPAA